MESSSDSTVTGDSRQTTSTTQIINNDDQKQQPFFKPFTKKNWDAIIDEFEKEEEKDVNALFKQIYESGNDEVRRAMNKSFQESGGTVLSTNWDNVAKKRVEPKPPSDNDDKSEDEVKSLI